VVDVPARLGARTGSTSLAVGLVLCVTVLAFEATAVVTVMPTITRQLNGDSLYGAAFSAFMLANLVSIVVCGEQADRRGPARSFGIGVTFFAAGLLVSGLAPSMPVLLVGRVLQGAGGGGLAATAYVAISRGYPPERQPKLFALLSSGWVIPSLVAPALAGFVAEHAGWRWVFLGLLPLVAALVVMVGPALVHLAVEPTTDVYPSRVLPALVLAGGAAALVAGLQADRLAVLLALSAVGLALAIPALIRLLPHGTARARPGEPAAVASRFLVNVAFFGGDIFLPLAAARLHGASSTVAGLVIIGGALSWTGGAALAARRPAHASASTVQIGFALLALGIAAVAPIAWAGFPLWGSFLAWIVAGAGIGLVFNTTSVAALSTAEPGREGLVSSRLQIADALGYALASGVGGAIVGVADRGTFGLDVALVLTFGAAAAAAVLGLFAGRGVVRRAPEVAVAVAV
jgi:MFS family permease